MISKYFQRISVAYQSGYHLGEVTMSQVRAIAASIWVGWHREFSWTNPILRLSLKTMAPVASVLTASSVYWLGSIQAIPSVFTPIRLAHILVGAALYAHVAAYSWVPTLAIAEGK